MKVITCCMGMLALAVLALAATPPAQAAVDSFFDVFTELGVAEPPYPADSAPPVQVGVASSTATGQLFDTEIVSMSLRGVNPGLPGAGKTTLVGSDLGPFSVDSFFDVFVELDPQTPAGAFPADSFFDVFVDLTAPDGKRGVIRNSDFTRGDSFFDVFVVIEFPDGGRQSHHLHGEIPPGQPATLGPANTDFNVDSFFDVFTELTIEDRPPANMPLINMRLTGNWTPEPATLSLLGAGGIVTLLKRRRRRH